MICINSIKDSTKVVNSRPSKKAAVVWRRRQGVKSGITFTTYERPALSENKPVVTANGMPDVFNLGRLIISIAQSFTHSQQAARYDSLWLAQTVEDTLSMSPQERIESTMIAAVTYDTLKRFDELAAVQYAAKHHLISTVKRRGRPSIN